MRKDRRELRRRYSRTAGIAIFMTAVVFLTALLLGSVTARADTDDNTVRIGFYEMGGFQGYDDLGNPTGYSVEYLSRISALTGWKYEYVNVGEYTDGLEYLENHEIDLLAPCQTTPERRELYEFSAYSFGTEYTALVTLEGNTKYNYEDYESFEGMTVGVVGNYLLTDHFKSYMQENGFHVKLRSYNSPRKALEALQEGKVEAAVTNLMMIGDGYKVLARFASEPFYYITWKGNEALMAQLDEAMRDMKNTYPDFENQLTERFFPRYNEQYFSAEDIEYINSIGEINVGYAPGKLPVSYADDETGELAGMTRDILERIQEISGLKFHYVELPYGSVTYDYLQEQDIRLVTSVEYNTANLNAVGVQISNPYLSTKKVIVGKENLNFDPNAELKVALSTGSQTIESVLTAEYPNFSVVYYDTVEECFEAVEDEDVDILLMNQYVADDWLRRPRYEKLRTIPVVGLDDNHCFSAIIYSDEMGTEKEQDGIRLISILNKAVSQITQDEIDAIILQEVMENHYSYTFFDFCYRYKIALGISVITIAGAFLTVIYITNLKRKAYMRQKEEEERLRLQQKRYQLIIDKSEEIIYEISLRGEGCLVSDKMQEKFGWTFPEQIEDPNVDSLMDIWKVHPEDKEKLRKSLIDMIDENNSTESLIRMRQADGEYIWCKVARFPLLDNDNILVSIVGKIADVDDEVKEKKKLELQSRTDGLTKLLNKKTFKKETELYLEQNKNISVGLIFIDLDHFKEVNDTLGHIVGDKAIKDAAKKLQVIFSNSDLVARFGGDEFCIFVNDISKNSLEDKLGWAVDKLKETYTDGGSIVKITASIGAVYCKDGQMSYQRLLDEADRAVYIAKENGRNQYVLKEKTH